MTFRILRRAVLLTSLPMLVPGLLAACGGAAFSIDSADAGGQDASVQDAGAADAAPDATPTDGGVCPPGQHQCLDCLGVPSCGSVCPNIACPVDAGARDAAPDIDATNDVCFPDGGTAPSLKACTTSDQCTYVRHVTNCCGSVELVGIASARTTAFAACEKVWEAQFPACGCFSGSVTTEDGKSDLDGAAPKVECESTSSGSQCMTSL